MFHLGDLEKFFNIDRAAGCKEKIGEGHLRSGGPRVRVRGGGGGGVTEAKKQGWAPQVEELDAVSRNVRRYFLNNQKRIYTIGASLSL
jgi:hypothetical protein